MTKKSLLKKTWLIIKATFRTFGLNNCTTLAAALSYYTIFSLAPLLVIIFALVGVFYGKDAIEGRIYSQIDQQVGHDAALSIQSFLENAYEPQNTLIATTIGAITLFFGATGLFAQLKRSFNTIFNIYPKPKREYLQFVLDRLLSFAFIIGIGLTMLATLVASTLINVLSKYIPTFLSSYSTYLVWTINIITAIIILSLLFSSMFKILSDSISRWRDILIGGFFTAVLFIIGEVLISLYLGKSNITSTYGTAGSVIAILVWVNYSSLILFLGASFTYVYAKIAGVPIEPNRFSVKLHHSPHPGEEDFDDGRLSD